MSFETGNIHFSRKNWQAVEELAWKSILRQEFCPEQTRVDNLRCVHVEEECEDSYGRQLWYFEVAGIDGSGLRQRRFGALELSIQYGVPEPMQDQLFCDPDSRHRFLHFATSPIRNRVWESPSTRFWVRTTIAAVAVLSLIWMIRFVDYLR